MEVLIAAAWYLDHLDDQSAGDRGWRVPRPHAVVTRWVRRQPAVRLTATWAALAVLAGCQRQGETPQKCQ